MGDDIHLAKTVANIAHTYLERVFSPVSLLLYPYNDVAKYYVTIIVSYSRLPNFDTSEIIKRGHRRTKSDGSSKYILG